MMFGAVRPRLGRPNSGCFKVLRWLVDSLAASSARRTPVLAACHQHDFPTRFDDSLFCLVFSVCLCNGARSLAECTQYKKLDGSSVVIYRKISCGNLHSCYISAIRLVLNQGFAQATFATSTDSRRLSNPLVHLSSPAVRITRIHQVFASH